MSVMPYAWVNRNPHPRLHAFGKVMSPGRIVALCRVQVREERGRFDPDDPASCEECADYVRRGLTFDDASREVAVKFAQAIEDLIGPHEHHPWHQVGRCVYCGPCGTRLYQGTAPDDHPRWTPKPRRTFSDELLERKAQGR